MNNSKVNLILFIEGFISVSIQIFIMRQLVPFIGSSVVAMSMVVSIFLLALAVGYVVGGNRRNNYEQVLARNFLIASAIIGICFSYPFVGLFFEGMLFGSILNGFLYLLLFLFPVVFVLGQTIPIMTNYVKEDGVAKIAGFSLALNTIGSVFGGLLTSLVFLYFFGVAKTVMLVVAGLVLLSFYVFRNKLNAFASILIVVFSFYANVYFENINFVKTNHYTNYNVVNVSSFPNKDDKILIMNNSYASRNKGGVEAFEYLEYIKFFINRVLEYKNKDILVLGAGGFTFTLSGDNDNNVNYVDIDKDLKTVAENYFLNRPIKDKFVVADGRVYLKEMKNKKDLILVDVYTHKGSIPWHFTTIEFVNLVKTKVKDDGWAIFNVIGGKIFNDDMTLTMHNTITSVFNNCFVSPFMEAGSEHDTNIVYMCKNKEFKLYYTDNYEKHSIDELKRERK